MSRFRSCLALLAFGLMAAPLGAQRPDSAMVGAWMGAAHINVDWTQQKELDVRVAIYADGTIAGSVGDAALVDARIHTNRSVLERALHLGSDYIIEAGLAGPIIRAEGIQRESVRLPINWNGSTFVGTISTSGTYDGGKDTMKLSATGLVLRRALPVVSSIR